MSFPINQKLVIGVSSSALFNLQAEDEIFKNDGIDFYKNYQLENLDVPLQKGMAFPFIRRLLEINNNFPEEQPVEVVILSRNSPETGLRVSRSIKHHNLSISRYAYTAGANPCKYMEAFNVALFLSTNKADVVEAIKGGKPAGVFLNSSIQDDTEDNQLRVAFDFDGVLADDSAERVYMESSGQLAFYFNHETSLKDEPLPPGPLQNFFIQLANIQSMEKLRMNQDPYYKRIIRTSIITARNAPADERAIKTLLNWNVDVDEMFLLGGIQKSRVIQEVKPHIFFDDQIIHLDTSIFNVPMVHIPFGIRNTVD